MKNTFLEKWFSPRHNRGIGLVLTVSGAMGFLLGCFVMPEWQVAVETAQVVAGTVEYPRDNPFYMYHVKLWTILHQLLAVLLKAGMSEQTASLWVSGMLGMITFQAFATIILALSGDWLLALGGTLAIYFARPNEVGVMYPVSFMGTEHTYGVLGLSYLLLVIGLLGGGWRRSGAFLLGLAPAAHPSLGLWLGVIVGLCCLLDIRRFRENWQPWLKFFFIGGAVTAVSLIIQMALIYDVPKSVPIDEAKYFNAFVSFWDMHRAPVPLAHPGILFNGGVLAIGIVWLIFFGKDLPSNSALIVRAAVVAAALGLGAMMLSWIPADKLPRTLVMLMPSRLLNVAIVTSLPVLIGLIGVYHEKVWGQSLLLMLLLGVLVGGAVQEGMLMFFSSNIWMLLVSNGADPQTLPKFMIHPWKWMLAVSIATMCAAAFSRWKSKQPQTAPAKKTKPSKAAVASVPSVSVMTIWLRRVSWVVFAGFLVLTVMLAVQLGKIRREQFREKVSSPVLAEVAKGKGLLLTAGDLHLIQLRTKRPVLLDGGGLDGVAYIVAAAPAMDEILKDIYQIDLFNPPEEARGAGTIPTPLNKNSWENTSPERWLEIAKKYGVNDVLTFADWNLALPRTASDESYVLYRIPSNEPGQ